MNPFITFYGVFHISFAQQWGWNSNSPIYIIIDGADEITAGYHFAECLGNFFVGNYIFNRLFRDKNQYFVKMFHKYLLLERLFFLETSSSYSIVVLLVLTKIVLITEY